MKIQPLRDYILLEEFKKELNSGIILPEGIDVESTQIAEIIAVGEDSKMKIGDKVLFKHYGFDEIIIEKKKYKIGKEESIIATISKE